MEGGGDQEKQKAYGWAAKDTSGHLSPYHFTRRKTGEQDVTFKVLYCAICHSDLHFIKNEWGNAFYPSVPGHEIVGIVTEVGNKVEKFKAGDKIGVGYFVGSCQSCDDCHNHLENYCSKIITTFGSRNDNGSVNHGGFSDVMVVDQHFAVRIPHELGLHELGSVAPLLCAGITVYSPLRYYGLDKPGLRLGVVGLGGVGHLAIKFAKAFGIHVTVISTSSDKKKDAVDVLGADSFLLSNHPDQMKAAIGTMDGIIDTVASVHPLLPLLGLLKSHGKLVLLGAHSKPLELPTIPLVLGRKMVAGTSVGGIKETQDMLEFAAKKGVKADVEVIPIDYVNTAMERMSKSDVKYRFVIDIANTLKPTPP